MNKCVSRYAGLNDAAYQCFTNHMLEIRTKTKYFLAKTLFLGASTLQSSEFYAALMNMKMCWKQNAEMQRYQHKQSRVNWKTINYDVWVADCAIKSV